MSYWQASYICHMGPFANGKPLRTQIAHSNVNQLYDDYFIVMYFRGKPSKVN